MVDNLLHFIVAIKHIFGDYVVFAHLIEVIHMKPFQVDHMPTIECCLIVAFLDLTCILVFVQLITFDYHALFELVTAVK